MEIIGVYWTAKVNILIISCHRCGRETHHPTNRWNVRCKCRRKRDLGDLREQYRLACEAGKNPLTWQGSSHSNAPGVSTPPNSTAT